MKGSRLIIAGCRGFWTQDPTFGDGNLLVRFVRGYRVFCVTPSGDECFIPIRQFEILSFPT